MQRDIGRQFHVELTTHLYMMGDFGRVDFSLTRMLSKAVIVQSVENPGLVYQFRLRNRKVDGTDITIITIITQITIIH